MAFETLLAVAAIVFFCGGLIKGLVGIGLPTVVIAVLSQFTDPRQAVALLIFPMLVSNVWQACRNRMFLRSIRLFWPFSFTLIVGIWIFAHFAAAVSAEAITAIVGFLVIVFVIVNLMTKPLAIPANLDLPFQLALGAIGGVMGGLTALWSPPMVMYLLSRRMEKDEFVGALGFLILMGAIPLAGAYWRTGLASPAISAWSVAMVLPTLIGMATGEFGRRYLDGEQFKKVLLAVFFVLGANLVRVSVF